MPTTASEETAIQEKDFQAQVVACAKLNGWTLIYHTHDSRRSAKGFPDLVLVHPRKKRIIFAELKSETGVASPEQVEWLAGLCRAEEVAPQTVAVRLWRPGDRAEIVRELGSKGAYLLR